MSSQNYFPAAAFKASEVQDGQYEPQKGNVPLLTVGWAAAGCQEQKEMSVVSNELKKAVCKSTQLSLIVGTKSSYYSS